MHLLPPAKDNISCVLARGTAATLPKDPHRHRDAQNTCRTLNFFYFSKPQHQLPTTLGLSLVCLSPHFSSWPAEPSELVSPHVAAAGWALQLPLAENLNTTLLVRLRAFN